MSNTSEPHDLNRSGPEPQTPVSHTPGAHTPGSHTPGSHTLGPHVVGRRVVVRRVLPGETGPSGGPALTDVLGICRSWGAGLCEIEREDGTVVTISLEHIVSGKPVPPRPSVRHRVGVREAELHTASLWPGLETAPLGEWLLRCAPADSAQAVSPAKRANSCLAVGDPGRDIEQAIAVVADFYAARRRPALVHTEVGSATAVALLERGWHRVEGGDAHFMIASTSRALRAAGRGRADIGEEPVLDEEGGRVTVRLCEPGGTGVAGGAAALDGDWLGLHRLHVEPGQRRRGLGTAVLAELLDWGAQHGATTAWLHVEADNEPARRLYEALGFSSHHEMTYLRAPG